MRATKTTNRAIASALGGVVAAAALGAVGCARTPPTAAVAPASVERAYGPLPETSRMLSVTLEESGGARASSLRLTRTAVGLIEDGETEHALDLLERAIAIDGGTGFAYLYIGYIHLQDGRADRAAPFIERGAALMPPYGPLEDELQALRLAARMEDAAARRPR